MSLLSIPPELRSIIFNLCFPPLQTPVQIIPYRASLPGCRLNLPLALYCICRLITSEIEPLPVMLRRLDFTYIIQGSLIHRSWRPEYGVKHDDDPEHFAFIMRFAERVRLVGSGPIRSRGRGLSSAMRILRPGPACALRVLEVQPRAWRKWFVSRIMLENLGPLTTHPDVAARLEVRLIRDADDPLESVEEVKARLRAYQARRDAIPVGKSSGPISVNLADLDGPVSHAKTNIRQIEAWLKRFQEVRGADVAQRAQTKGPLGGYNDSDDSE
ncbi:hypothetical protein B0H17DRAFT_1176568 [Mycena rosella]|uniref:Uncharacterized protein n=1 Tax=Mycena rosella TaxID=1033263 RepID=A0AAD7DX03_MYCRO|nr:hypothetical protein B0H17DRAFT_1176568 [Mycena rosella]